MSSASSMSHSSEGRRLWAVKHVTTCGHVFAALREENIDGWRWERDYSWRADSVVSFHFRTRELINVLTSASQIIKNLQLKPFLSFLLFVEQNQNIRHQFFVPVCWQFIIQSSINKHWSIWWLLGDSEWFFSKRTRTSCGAVKSVTQLLSSGSRMGTEANWENQLERDADSMNLSLLTCAEPAWETSCFKFSSVPQRSSDGCLSIHRFTANRKC